jgi:gluconolactonase
LGANGTFRESSFDSGFNPTGTEPPFFQIFDLAFLEVLGKAPTITEIASNSTFAFAHEAPIYVAALDSVFFASNDGGPLGMSDIDHNNQVGRINLKDVPANLNGTAINILVTEVRFV